jgi:uncharacterized membrane protein YfcA
MKGHFIKINIAGFSAGLSAGIIGMGTGMLLVPVITELGVVARAATATSSFLLIWVGSTAAFIAIFMGLIAW